MLYKRITKIIVDRIKPFLEKSISPTQSSFVPNGSIHGNIVIAQEMLHSMRKSRGKLGFMAI